MSTCRRQGNTYKRHRYVEQRSEADQWQAFPVRLDHCVHCGHPYPQKYRPLVRKRDALPESCVESGGEMSESCGLCGHDLTDNSHGFDQNDAWMEGDELKHSGRCTYCKMCNPALFSRVRETYKSPESCVECGQVGFHKMSCDTRSPVPLDTPSES